MFSKTLFIVFTLIGLKGNFETVLTKDKWKFEYAKTYKGNEFPDSKAKPDGEYYEPPAVGRIVKFHKDHTCEQISPVNKDQLFWNSLQWSIEDNFLRLRYSGGSIGYSIHSFNNDSIILYSPAIGIETGVRIITVYKLVPVK